MAEAFDTIPKGRKMSEQTPIHFHEEVVRSEASSSIDPETTRPIQATTEVLVGSNDDRNASFYVRSASSSVVFNNTKPNDTTNTGNTFNSTNSGNNTYTGNSTNIDNTNGAVSSCIVAVQNTIEVNSNNAECPSDVKKQIRKAKRDFRASIGDFVRSCLALSFENNPLRFRDPAAVVRTVAHRATLKIFEREVAKWESSNNDLNKLNLSVRMKSDIKAFVQKEVQYTGHKFKKM